MYAVINKKEEFVLIAGEAVGFPFAYIHSLYRTDSVLQVPQVFCMHSHSVQLSLLPLATNLPFVHHMLPHLTTQRMHCLLAPTLLVGVVKQPVEFLDNRQMACRAGFTPAAAPVACS